MSTRFSLMACLRVVREDVDGAVAWRLGATTLLVVAGGLLAALAPLALKGLVDEIGLVHGSGDTAASGPTMLLAMGYLLAVCIGRLLAELRSFVIGGAEQRLYARMRQRCFRRLLDLPLSFHLEQRTGALGQMLQQAISGYQIIVFNLVHCVVPVLVELLAAILVLIALSQPALTATFVLIALAHLLALRLGREKLSRGARGVADATMDMQSMLADHLLNFEAIKCYQGEGPACERFGRAAGELETRWKDLRDTRMRIGAGVTALFALSLTAVIAVALHGLLHGSLSIGGFVLANAYVFQIVRPLETLGSATRDLAQAVEFIRPFARIMEAPTEEARTFERTVSAVPCDPLRGSPAPWRGDPAEDGPPVAAGLSLRNVRLAWDGRTVLDGVNLDIPEGGSVAIVGTSGSGKSSLMRLLLRLHEPVAGKIFLDGVDIATLPTGELRGRMAFVPQDTILFNESLAFNIGVGNAGASRQDLEHAADVAELNGFIASLPDGFDTLVGDRGMKLSGGERQRIAIARAVIADPAICLFDEATSMLDAVTERAIMRNLGESSARRTTITVAHRLSTIQSADRIIVMQGGRVIESGDHATLLTNRGVYASMWHSQRNTAEP